MENISNSATFLPFGIYTKSVTGLPTYNDYTFNIVDNGYIGIEGELISYSNRNAKFSNISRNLKEVHVEGEPINCIRKYDNNIKLNDSNYIL